MYARTQDRASDQLLLCSVHLYRSRALPQDGTCTDTKLIVEFQFGLSKSVPNRIYKFLVTKDSIKTADTIHTGRSNVGAYTIHNIPF